MRRLSLANHKDPQLTDGQVHYSRYNADRGIHPLMLVWVGRLRYHGTVPTGRRS